MFCLYPHRKSFLSLYTLVSLSNTELYLFVSKSSYPQFHLYPIPPNILSLVPTIFSILSFRCLSNYVMLLGAQNRRVEAIAIGHSNGGYLIGR